MADLVERRTACMCQDVEIGSHAVSVGLKLPSHMQDYSAARVASGLSPDIAVDACLVVELRRLWTRRIRTYGSCCGHNKTRSMINVHDDDAKAMLAMGYEQWPEEDGRWRATFFPKSVRGGDLARAEAEGERRGLERAAEVADAAAKDFDNPHNHSLGVANDLIEACSEIASDIRALIPEAPVWEDWRPISSAPKDGTVVWFFEPHDLGGYMFAGTINADGVWINNLDLKAQSPTHWRPLPAPPQDHREG